MPDVAAVAQTAPAPFIIGLGRSGTTLLRLMLDRHSHLAIPSETHFILKFSGASVATLQAEPFIDVLISSPTWPNFDMSEAELRQAIANSGPFSVANGLRAFYRQYAARKGKPRWGDKTPPYRCAVMEIQQLLPEVRFIHIIRDGRDVALSYRGLWFGPGDDIEAQAHFWVDQILAVRRQAQTLQYYQEIKYEDLVTDPEATLSMVCAHLDLIFEPDMLRYYEDASLRLSEVKQAYGPGGGLSMEISDFNAIHERTKHPPDIKRVGRWKREMPERERLSYEDIAGSLLRKLGYENKP